MRKIKFDLELVEGDVDTIISIYRQLAEHGPVDKDFGICWNSSHIAHEMQASMDMYQVTDFMFSIALEVDRFLVSAYPIKDQRRYNNQWYTQTRKKWCEVFANALETGIMNIPEKLFKTLNPALPPM